jgi:predicted GNAT family acetyltransferase
VRVVTVASAQEALHLMESQLRDSGAEGELAYGMLCRLRDEPEIWGKAVTMLVGIEDERPVAFVIRTGDHPALIVGFVSEDEIDFDAFVREMLRRDRVPTSVNGAVRCSVPFAAAWEGALGCSSRTLRGLRAFELRDLRAPSTDSGRARVVEATDSGLLEAWCDAFIHDIGDDPAPGHAAKAAARFIARGDMMLWVTEEEPVSMAAINRRTPSSSCVAWVYTPPQHRRRGYGSAIVAALSQRELAAGASWCSLFTDIANPTSNHIYAELGYEPRCDYRHIELLST